MKDRRKRTIRLGYVLLAVAALVYLARAVSLSLFVTPPDRLNVVFYSEQTYLYSLGIENGIHYIMPFPSNMKVQVPGGYGEYRVGALGKLIGLEKDPSILTRTFSYNSSSFVPYYFYPADASIYFAQEEEGIHTPSFKDIMFSRSNAAFLDKLFLYMRFTAASQNDFIKIDVPAYSEKEGTDVVFSSEDFRKKFIAYLFSKTYRTERKTVQIIYTEDYNTAVGIGDILEGNGIRVVDISRKKHDSGPCRITEELADDSATAMDMKYFFGCDYAKETSSISDIVLTLGSLEQKWELNL